MKNFLDLLTAIVILAIVNYVTMALGIALLALTLMAALTYPGRTLQLVAALGLLTLAIMQPAACILTLGVVGAVGVVAHQLRRRCTPPKSLLLPHTPEVTRS